MVRRATDVRVSNVLSKIGEVDNKQFGKLLGLFIQDVIDEIEREEGYNPKGQSGDEWKAINTLFTKEASKVVREVFLKSLNNKNKNAPQ